MELFELFDHDGVALVFLDMNIDTSTSQGRLLRHIMAAFAEYESDVKADYARASHRLARSQGLPWGLPESCPRSATSLVASRMALAAAEYLPAASALSRSWRARS